MIAFLEAINKENPENLYIILDNAQIHHANLVKKKAEELNTIHDFDKMDKKIDNTALKLFHNRKHTYANHWINKFISAKN